MNCLRCRGDECGKGGEIGFLRLLLFQALIPTTHCLQHIVACGKRCWAWSQSSLYHTHALHSEFFIFFAKNCPTRLHAFHSLLRYLCMKGECAMSIQSQVRVEFIYHSNTLRSSLTFSHQCVHMQYCRIKASNDRIREGQFKIASSRDDYADWYSIASQPTTECCWV